MNSLRQLPASHLQSRIWHCGAHRLALGEKTLVMAILNLTPDSFSGDGLIISEHRVLDALEFDARTLGARTLDEIVRRAEQMIEDGADILDLGGESTRPGATAIDDEEEMRRVLPIVEKLAARVGVPLSVDTTKSRVAHRVLEAGASIINDISGATSDEKMLEVLARSDCGVVLMHRRGTPQNMKASERQLSANSGSRPEKSANLQLDVIAEVLSFWRERVEVAQKIGIARERIALDAGFGFGKSLEENLEIVRRGRELSAFGFPTLSATSRKSTIGRVLDSATEGGAPIEDRLFGTAATVALAIANGAQIVRVHDVREMAQVARMTDAILRR